MHLTDFLVKFPPPGKIIFAKVWGSRSHNTHKEGSDTDFSGVYVCKTRDILSLDPPQLTTKYDKEESEGKEDHPDHQFHEVGKFCNLLITGNPSILEMLYTERLYQSTDPWHKLRDIRDKFLSVQAVHQYLGYMNGQLKRLTAHEGKKGLHTTGGNYNEKWAYHILRLAEDAKRIAKGKGPVVWKEGQERDLLMTIRHGNVAWGAVKVLIDEAILEIEAMKPYSALPAVGDKAALNNWLIEVRKENWDTTFGLN